MEPIMKVLKLFRAVCLSVLRAATCQALVPVEIKQAKDQLFGVPDAKATFHQLTKEQHR
jgi:hypothetical protein